MNIAVIGTGYVGLVTGTCLSDFGHKVICIDINDDKIEDLKKGIVPIYELGLEDLIHKNLRQQRLNFTTDLEAGIKYSEVIFIAVGTPSGEDSEADLSAIKEAAREIGKCINGYKIIVNKSTVPVGTTDKVAQIIGQRLQGSFSYDVVSNPEFLREGRAILDFIHPHRIVVGVKNKKAAKTMRELYKPIDTPLLVTDIRSAEMIKYASNTFLASKISFINEIANICEKVGADIGEVAKGMGLDERIGPKFLEAGVGFGGSCFPKDVKALIKIAEKTGYEFQIPTSAMRVNEYQKRLVVVKAKEVLGSLTGKTIGVLGLAFKPNTDDMRQASSIKVVREFQKEGARVKAYDPKAMENAKKVLKDVTYVHDAYEAASDSDVLVILTEWEKFKNLDLQKVKKLLNQPIIIDGRNIYEPSKMSRLGFIYKSIGR